MNECIGKQGILVAARSRCVATLVYVLLLIAALSMLSGCMTGTDKGSTQRGSTLVSTSQSRQTGTATPINATVATINPPSQASDAAIHSMSDLDPEYLRIQLTYASGGASGCNSYGQSDSCLEASSGPLELFLGGIYSTKEQYRESPFWGNKYTSCKAKIEFGDMVYFVARGFPARETVTFKLNGPLGSETHAVVSDHQAVIGPSCGIVQEYDAARFSWVASAQFGAGDYELTAESAAGNVSLQFRVFANDGANFGAGFGAEGIPLLLAPGEPIELVYTGFPPHHTVTTLLFSDPIQVADIPVPPPGSVSDLPKRTTDFSAPLGGVEVPTSANGDARVMLTLPANYPEGLYSLLTPELIPGDLLDSNIVSAIEPFQLYAIQFRLDRDGDTPQYESDELQLTLESPAQSTEQPPTEDPSIQFPFIVYDDINTCRAAKGTYPLVIAAREDSPWCLIYPTGTWTGEDFDRFVLDSQAWTWVKPGCNYRLDDDSNDGELFVDYSPKQVTGVVGTIDYIIVSCQP